MPTCKLCKNERKLCDSHIYPEFLYKPLYDEHHSYFTLSTSSNKYPKRPKKGIYDKLLCKHCESKLSKYESYASKVLYGGLELDFQNKGNVIEVSDLDYHKFKLFLLSILWRASIHSRDEFPKLDLGPHGEILRQMILEENPGEYYEYATFMTTVHFDQEFLSEFILPLEPTGNRIEGIRIYRGLFSGLFWGYLVSSHNYNFPFKQVLLNKKGEMKIIRDMKGSHEFMNKVIQGFMQNENNLKIRTT